MFIRRKRRRLKKAHPDEKGKLRDDWTASDFVLISSTRTPAGPRQRVIGYIGSLEDRLADRDHIRHYFYRQAIPRLQLLVPPRQYRALLKSLEADVPRPAKGYKPPTV
jgi:hypothetical protein